MEAMEQLFAKLFEEQATANAQKLIDELKPVFREIVREELLNLKPANDENDSLYYSTKEVLDMLGGISQPALYRKKQKKGFPKSAMQNGSGSLYLKSQVNQWLMNQGTRQPSSGD